MKFICVIMRSHEFVSSPQITIRLLYHVLRTNCPCCWEVQHFLGEASGGGFGASSEHLGEETPHGEENDGWKSSVDCWAGFSGFGFQFSQFFVRNFSALFNEFVEFFAVFFFYSDF